MQDLKNTYFDDALDGYLPVVPGVYPAHVTELDTREFDSGSTVFNVTFQLAEECKNLQVPKLIKNGEGWAQEKNDNNEPVTIDGSYLISKKFRSQGVWLTPNPEPGQGWRNRNYKEFFSSLGITFEEQDGKTKLGFVEKEDVLGMPSLVKLGEEEYEQDGQTKKAMRVFSCYTWNDGTRLSEEELGEDVPF
jgi:hypothetical protein